LIIPTSIYLRDRFPFNPSLLAAFGPKNHPLFLFLFFLMIQDENAIIINQKAYHDLIQANHLEAVNICLSFSSFDLDFLEFISFCLYSFALNTNDCFFLCHFLFFVGSFFPIRSSILSRCRFFIRRRYICSPRFWYSSRLRSLRFEGLALIIRNGEDPGSGSVTLNRYVL
jgi:hypothetical protein